MTAPIRTFLDEARAAVSNGAKEHATRAIFIKHLTSMFPDNPWWVRAYAQGVEKHTTFLKGGKLGHGFVDTLVGATAVEFEADLSKAGVAEHACKQIREYIAGLLNAGTPVENALGIISDTVRWRAFAARLPIAGAKSPFGESDIDLIELATLDLSKPTSTEETDFARFIERYLGRIGARPLLAADLAKDLGIDTPVGTRRRTALDDVYSRAAEQRPAYADLIARLWTELVDSIGRGGSRQLGVTEYIDELYLITLAKLICANVLEPKNAELSDDELAAILTGSFFSDRSLPNYVEYDLFGWLSEDAASTGMLTVAREIHGDLAAYDFQTVIQQDLFGRLLSMLGKRHTRLILGQELTPSWLARRMVRGLAERLDEPLRLVDTACGSGAMLLEALAIEQERELDESPAQTADRMLQCATGFDVDPVAALFAKTNWVIAMREHRDHLQDVTIPIFHADSLFAGLSEDDDRFRLQLDDTSVEPPASLLTGDGRPVFDQLLTMAYKVAMVEAKHTAEPDTSISREVAQTAIAAAADPSAHSIDEITEFAEQLIRQIAILQRDGRNGLWTYVIRNTSRAVQASHQFNALAINPPWLALSKIKDNPYGDQLARMATAFAVKPAAQSALHVEMATVFLLEGARRYLAPNGVFACILPDAVMNGDHQNRFRAGAYASGSRKVSLDIDEIWQVEGATFKNEAVVLLGRKAAGQPRTRFDGLLVDAEVATSQPFHVHVATYPDKPDRSVWSSTPSAGPVSFGHNPAPFRQGADLMPRTAWFHDLRKRPNGRFAILPAAANKQLRYLVAQGKKARDFVLPSIEVDNDFVLQAVLSNQLTQFDLADAARCILPARYAGDEWRAVTDRDLMLHGVGTRSAFAAIARSVGVSVDDLFSVVNLRSKLTVQNWTRGAYIVVSGAGGTTPCVAFLDPINATPGNLVFDQTVYWAPVATRDEAVYLCGAMNSPTCAALIRPFQPKGAQGPRHVHELPFRVTPRFDPRNTAHEQLVIATNALMQELSATAAVDAKVGEARQPHTGELSRRRPNISKAMQQTAAWPVYVEAASAVYHQ